MMKVVCGNSNRPLAEAICQYLNVPMTRATVKRFADMEVFVEIQDNVRGQDMFVMTRTFPRGHVHPDDVRAALVDIARRSDWVEEQLTHADVY